MLCFKQKIVNLMIDNDMIEPIQRNKYLIKIVN